MFEVAVPDRVVYGAGRQRPAILGSEPLECQPVASHQRCLSLAYDRLRRERVLPFDPLDTGRYRHRPSIASTSAFDGRTLVRPSRLIDVGDAAAHIHEAAAIVGVEPWRGGAQCGSKAGAGRDQTADDDVFLQAAQIVLEAARPPLP